MFHSNNCFISDEKYFKEIGVHADVKYIDPTYMIRACRANASDGILCTVLGQNAVSLSPSLSFSCCIYMISLFVIGSHKAVYRPFILNFLSIQLGTSRLCL